MSQDIRYPCGCRHYCGQARCRHAPRCIALQNAAAAPRRPKKAAQPLPGGAKTLARPADVVYLYDGSLSGFYCCVYESVYSRTLPCAIWPETEAQPTLFETRLIEISPEKAKRVARSIPAKIGERAAELVQTVFLSCLAEKEMALLRFLLLGYDRGSCTPLLLGHPDVAPVLEAEKHLGGEAHLLKGFVRFSDYGGMLAATISPKNFVLPFIQGHFIARYRNENFMIFDKTHRAALIYENRKARIVPLEGIRFPEASESEEGYRALWKRFYNTVAIKARENPRCRITHMPKRYWENMLEVSGLLQPKPYNGV